MKNIVNKITARFYTSSQLFLSGALLFGVIQIPFSPEAMLNKTSTVKVTEKAEAVSEVLVEKPVELFLAEEFLGKEVKKDVANSIVEKKMAFVSSRPAYPASLAVIKKHENTIRKEARENGVPEDVAIGVGLLENGGSETAKSPAGALGVFQLIPAKNIEAGMVYLKTNYERFGDWGLATWAYHAGEGNVSKALKLYAKANHGVTLAGIKEPKQMRDYVKKYGVTVHKLLSNSAVKNFTKKLNDDSAGYPYKVMATAKLFKEAKKGILTPGLISETQEKKI